MKTGNIWDIFCKVIDNFGDIGICWRLSAGLAARGERVRLWVDDPGALGWMAPEGTPGVEVRLWTQPIATDGLTMGDILVEAFGCDIAPEFIASYAAKTRASGQKPIWINLEYLSAEAFVERNHGLPSPVMVGPGSGLTKRFYYPGFTAATGGLLREPDLLARQAAFDRTAWLQHQLGTPCHGERLVSLFCYEPAALGDLLELLANSNPVGQTTRLLVTAGRATAAVKACIEEQNDLKPLWNLETSLSFSYLPSLGQHDFDHLLWSCDLNFVRGEDSVVRAIWADKPFVWQIYPQHDDAHHSKLDAFLDMLQAPATLRAFHHAWNGVVSTDKEALQVGLPPLALYEWQTAVSATRGRLLQLDDLVTQIMRFI